MTTEPKLCSHWFSMPPEKTRTIYVPALSECPLCRCERFERELAAAQAEIENLMPQPCCQDYDNCIVRCEPKAGKFRARAEAAELALKAIAAYKFDVDLKAAFEAFRKDDLNEQTLLYPGIKDKDIGRVAQNAWDILSIWRMTAAIDAALQRQAEELDALKHDIARHVQIASDQAKPE